MTTPSADTDNFLPKHPKADNNTTPYLSSIQEADVTIILIL